MVSYKGLLYITTGCALLTALNSAFQLYYTFSQSKEIEQVRDLQLKTTKKLSRCAKNINKLLKAEESNTIPWDTSYYGS